MLEVHPLSGHAIQRGRRELVVGSYVVVHRVNATEVRVLRVWHGAQDRPS